MSRRTLFLSMGAGLLVVITLFGFALWMFLGSGSLQVQVDGRDHPRFAISLPFSLLHAGVMLMPNEVFAEVRDELDHELGSISPAIEAFCESLAHCPDGEYLRVESGEESVVILKKRRHLHIIVEEYDESVRVKVPIKALEILGEAIVDA